ncbi:hypothetical protein Bca101_058916 [Brassica carinata]
MKRGFLGPSKKEPAGFCTIRKSTREVSIDTLQAASIDSVSQASNDTIHHMSIDTVHPVSIDTIHSPSIDTVHPVSIDTVHLPSIDTVHRNTVHSNTVHRMSSNVSSMEIENDERLILKIDKKGIWRDKEGRPRSSTDDPVKLMVPFAVFEAESPIPPDKGVNLSSYIEVLDDQQHVEASQKGLRFIDEVDKGPIEAPSIDTYQIPSIDTLRESEQNEFDVCQNLFDGGTTMRSDKSMGKKRRNWKKRKRIKGDPQLSLIPHFSDGIRKFRVCSRCFSQPFAKLRALLIAEMIDK